MFQIYFWKITSVANLTLKQQAVNQWGGSCQPDQRKGWITRSFEKLENSLKKKLKNEEEAARDNIGKASELSNLLKSISINEIFC